MLIAGNWKLFKGPAETAAFCLALRRKGWRLVYDPDVEIDHYQAERSDEDQRNSFSAEAHANTVHNRTVLTLDHLRPAQRPAYLAYAFLVGSNPLPGLAVMGRAVLRREPRALAFWWATTRGHVSGIATASRRRRP